MTRPSKGYVPTAAEIAWRMGGRICDLPAGTLDQIGVVCAQSPWRPPAIVRAQQLMDAYAERYPVDGEVAS